MGLRNRQIYLCLLYSHVMRYERNEKFGEKCLLVIVIRIVVAVHMSSDLHRHRLFPQYGSIHNCHSTSLCFSEHPPCPLQISRQSFEKFLCHMFIGLTSSSLDACQAHVGRCIEEQAKIILVVAPKQGWITLAERLENVLVRLRDVGRLQKRRPQSVAHRLHQNDLARFAETHSLAFT